MESVCHYNEVMSRYRLTPTRAQEGVLREHCTHARFVWNLCVEQESWWRPGRGSTPGHRERCKQLTEARAEYAWLRAGSSTVQQEAIGDFVQAMANYFRGSHGKPAWRKAGRNEGFRVVGTQARRVLRLSRYVGAILVPKVGWVRFRWSRAVPTAKSYRVTLDRSGRWHVAFAAIPKPIPGPGTGDVVGIDRGVAVSAALSTGEMLRCPGLSAARSARLQRLLRRMRRAKRGSNRRRRTRLALARLCAREVDSRKDWVEALSTDLARRFDVIRIEDLKIRNMTRSAKGTVETPGANVRAKAGLNREILRSGWGLLVKRLEDKAPGRVEKVPPHFTSQRCSCCGHVDAESRKSQALFACTACGYSDNADVNAAKNIAAGHAVTARGGDRVTGPVNREPQIAA